MYIAFKIYDITCIFHINITRAFHIALVYGESTLQANKFEPAVVLAHVRQGSKFFIENLDIQQSQCHLPYSKQ